MQQPVEKGAHLSGDFGFSCLNRVGLIVLLNGDAVMKSIGSVRYGGKPDREIEKVGPRDQGAETLRLCGRERAGIQRDFNPASGKASCALEMDAHALIICPQVLRVCSSFCRLQSAVADRFPAVYRKCMET